MPWFPPCVAAVTTCFALSASSPAAVTVQFVLTSQWDGGFVADVRLTNTGPAAVNGWTLAYDWSPQVTTHWNMELATTPIAGGYRCVATPASWNGSIAAGSTITLGLVANGSFTQTVANCSVNGVAVTPTYSGSSGGGPTASVSIAGVAGDADAFRISPGASSHGLSLSNGAAADGWTVRTNNPRVLSASIAKTGDSLRLDGLAPGFASITLREAASGATRTIGVAIEDAAGTLAGLPPHVALGSVSEDTAAHLDFFRGYGPDAEGGNRFVDIRYIYINGGPVNGWRTWTTVPGDRARRYVKESKRLGMIPCFVFYNVPDGGESLWTNTEHLQSASYMAGYWKDLDLFCDVVRDETADGWPVMVILEPDCLGYFAQAGYSPNGTQVVPRVDVAYATSGFDGGPILTAQDPTFPNTIRGFVRAVNHILRRDLPNGSFGWQFNLWASPPGGFTGTPIPGNGICRLTDTYGIVDGRTRLDLEARAITQWYVDAGVLEGEADFVSIDKYGLDAVGANPSCATNPASGPWFWHADHWNNYLRFVKAMHETSGRPVILWQVPVGRLNATTTVRATDGQPFADLDNTVTHYEDSATTFLFGDSFEPGSTARRDWFATNAGGDASVSAAGPVVTWGEHVTAARDAGVTAILCGAGVGASTTNLPPSSLSEPGPTDGGFWMQKAQEYYLDPVPLATAGPADVNGDGRVDSLDLGAVLSGWGTASPDLDGNGTVDGADVAMVLTAWTG